MVIGHGDPAPYNAAWTSTGLVGFFDWDNAGPTTRQDDVAWVGFAWTPLHARPVVEAEGFTAFEQRRDRLETFLAAYGWAGTTDEVLALVDARLAKQVEVMRATAAAGDPAYRAMLLRGQDKLLDTARRDLGKV
jgi:aminoglycoside phosphotransferase (APT) family kinase protein